MAYVKIVSGVVVQKQYSPADGFVEVDDSVVCGMLFDGVAYSIPPESLDDIKAAKLLELKTAADAVGVQPVVHNLISWHGGYESAMKIKGKVDMLEFGGQLEGSIFDTADVYHTMLLADMLGVAYAIAMAYETVLTKYKGKCADVEAALTPEAVALVVW